MLFARKLTFCLVEGKNGCCGNFKFLVNLISLDYNCCSGGFPLLFIRDPDFSHKGRSSSSFILNTSGTTSTPSLHSTNFLRKMN